MQQKATYKIRDVFKITGRGIVLAGYIIDGTLSAGDEIEFTAFNKIRRRKITATEGITFSKPNPTNTGLLIACENDSEIEELRNWKPEEQVVVVY